MSNRARWIAVLIAGVAALFAVAAIMDSAGWGKDPIPGRSAHAQPNVSSAP